MGAVPFTVHCVRRHLLLPETGDVDKVPTKSGTGQLLRGRVTGHRVVIIDTFWQML